MTIPQEGNATYHDIKCDAERCAAYRREYSRLRDARNLTSNGDAQITSSTVNGQSFAVLPGMPTAKRMAILRWVVACLDHGGPISTTQISTF